MNETTQETKAQEENMTNPAELAQPVFVPPTKAEMKAALKDPNTPDVVRRHLREQLYGEGGGGRKATQQRSIQRFLASVRPGQHVVDPAAKRPKEMSGRQFRNIRKAVRKIARSYASSSQAR